MVDGEVVIVTEDGLAFDTLQNRLHPAASRVNKLAKETPASFVAFDLLALGDRDLTGEPFRERRRLLEGILDQRLERVHLTPMTEDPDVAEDWFTRFEGAGFDGVMAKPADQPYVQDKRVMWKVKHERTADCVVAGFRWHKDGEGVGSLLLGLFDDEGTLHHVGVASSFTAARRKRAGRRAGAAARGRDAGPSVGRLGRGTGSPRRAASPVGMNRWNAQKDMSWVPLRCRAGGGDPLRARAWPAGSATCGRLVRFRPDREPASCTYGQLEEVAPAELAALFPEA